MVHCDIGADHTRVLVGLKLEDAVFAPLGLPLPSPGRRGSPGQPGADLLPLFADLTSRFGRALSDLPTGPNGRPANVDEIIAMALFRQRNTPTSWLGSLVSSCMRWLQKTPGG